MDANQKNFEKELKAFDKPVELKKAERWYLWLKITFFLGIFFMGSFYYLVFNLPEENVEYFKTLGNLAFYAGVLCGLAYVVVLGFTANVFKKSAALWVCVTIFFHAIGALIAFLVMAAAIDDARRGRDKEKQSGDAEG